MGRGVYGFGSALKTVGWRVPSGTPWELQLEADAALDAIVSVLHGHFESAQDARNRLQAAQMIREEVCGRIVAPEPRQRDHGRRGTKNQAGSQPALLDLLTSTACAGRSRVESPTACDDVSHGG